MQFPLPFVMLVASIALCTWDAARASDRFESGTQPALDWTRLDPGQAAGDFTFMRDGRLSYRGRVFSGVSFGERSGAIALSPIAGEQYAIAIAVERDSGLAFLLRLKQTAANRIGAADPFRAFVSWSPDLSHALLATSYEGTSKLVLVSLDPFATAELSLPVSGGEEHSLDVKSTRWTDPRRVLMRVAVNCNPYSDRPCATARSVILRRYELELDVNAKRVSELPNPAPAPRGDDRNARSSGTPTVAPSVSGEWRGSGLDSSGPGQMIWTLVQQDRNVSGRVKVTDPISKLTFDAVLKGELSGPDLKFTLSVARGTLPRPYHNCEVILNGAATVTAQEIRGTYAGTSCGKPVTNGELTLLRR